MLRNEAATLRRGDNLRFADASVRGTLHLVELHCVAPSLRLH